MGIHLLGITARTVIHAFSYNSKVANSMHKSRYNSQHQTPTWPCTYCHSTPFLRVSCIVFTYPIFQHAYLKCYPCVCRKIHMILVYDFILYTRFKWYTVQYMPSLTSPKPGMGWWFNFCSALLAMSAEGNSMKQWCVVPLGRNRNSNILVVAKFPV